MQKCNYTDIFLSRLLEKYSLQKKPETQHDSIHSSEEYSNEVMQAVNDPLTQDLACSAAGEDDLMAIFKQFAR